MLKNEGLLVQRCLRAVRMAECEAPQVVEEKLLAFTPSAIFQCLMLAAVQKLNLIEFYAPQLRVLLSKRRGNSSRQVDVAVALWP